MPSGTTGFNINEFKANLDKHGYIDNNSFEVYVKPPSLLRNYYVSNQGTPVDIDESAKNLRFRIDQVRAPGTSIMSMDTSRYGVGPTQKMPYTAAFAETNISVLGDHFCEFWQFWYHWTRSVFEFNSASSSQNPSYYANYKEEYSSIIMIVIYDHYGNIVQKINLFEAFPTAVREIPLAWGDSNLMKINVSIAFTEYTIEGSGVERKIESQPSGLSNSREVNTVTTGLPTIRI